MAPLPQVRVNTLVPFPAMVRGAGPITIAKQAGVWTVGYQVENFATETPPAADYPNDFVLVWDAAAGSFFKVSLATLQAAVSGVRPQRLVTASPIVIVATDQVVNVNIAAGAPVCVLPPAAGRAGLPLSFKDVGGHFAANPLTLTASGADTIDGAASITLETNYQYLNLVPANDGTTTGWSIE